MMYVFFHLPLHVLSLFCFYTHASYLFVCNFMILFHTKMSWWILFKVFQNYRLSKSTCHKLSSCKVFQEFVLGQILLYSTSEYELSDLWLFSYVHLLVVVLSRIAKGGDCYDICVSHVIEHMLWFYVIGLSFDKTHFTCIWVDLECV